MKTATTNPDPGPVRRLAAVRAAMVAHYQTHVEAARQRFEQQRERWQRGVEALNSIVGTNLTPEDLRDFWPAEMRRAEDETWSCEACAKRTMNVEAFEAVIHSARAVAAVHGGAA